MGLTPCGGLSSPDKAYTFNRVIINPEDTFNLVLPLATSATSTQTLPQILNGITVDSGTIASRNITQNQPADIFGMNVVGLTPVFIFQYTNTATTPATTTYFYAAPDSPLNRQIYNAQNFSTGFGGPTGAGFNPVFFTDLKISGGKYAVSTTASRHPARSAWKDGTLTAVIFSLTVVDDSGADEIRAIQTRGSGQLQPADWQRIMQQQRQYTSSVSVTSELQLVPSQIPVLTFNPPPRKLRPGFSCPYPYQLAIRRHQNSVAESRGEITCCSARVRRENPRTLQNTRKFCR